MTKYTVIRLCSLTPLHIGTGRENHDFAAGELHSDSISAALASIRASLGKTHDIGQFLSSFVISSAFPFYSKTYFLPKPIGNINVSVQNMPEHSYRKELKRIKYIDLSLWNRLISGGEHCVVDKEQIKGEFLVENPDSYQTISRHFVQERVTVARDESDAKPFFFDWHYFNPNGGLYCLLKSNDATADEIVRLFKLLGQNGIGSDRNIGGGQFDVEVDFLELVANDFPTKSMLLSMYIPQKEEVKLLNLPNSQYSIMLRGGYISGSSSEQFLHLRKRSVYMFTPGSIFNTTAELKGTIVDLRPDWNNGNMHPIFRSGQPFVVNI